MGLLVLADENDTAASLLQKLVASANVRVAPGSKLVILHRGRSVDPRVTVKAMGVEALERIDVVADSNELL